ncbi:MAG: ligase-associated DNA damage response endonuclease PdeM [Piscinibacter sp.]|uniref:ligase-associated DNA damage response endonuclease PdeM n=1 Tax=Piscinibacter sp. TaxID=1903157 RepID=UPI002589126C|nr:ligase-associated DNA damage response endonuclease PdeM [Piscinibacter sp.]MCW5665989.1 ligase-associated DNA damage response endonuclease PdeM [Piscinibacter sp.]
MVTIEVGGRPLVLLPQKAALLPQSHTLLVADAHIGKAVSFRALGVPVPRGTTSDTLARLSGLVERHGVRRVVFLGDLLHSARSHAAATLSAFARWRERHAALDLLLVRGNHDDRAGDPPASLRIEVVDEPHLDGGFALCHHPQPHEAAYVLAGHLHPCVALGGRAHDRLRLPCFHLGERVGVLPAFGSFTGMHALERGPADRVFVIADDELRELPS